MILVQSQYCTQNHPCPTLRSCPTGALKQQGYSAPTIDAESCIECGRCVSSCRVFKEVAEPSPVAATGAMDSEDGSPRGWLGRLSRRSGV